MASEASTAAPAGTAVLRAIGLTKRFGDVTAVDDLSIELHRGEVFGFIGPNGAGKSTTVRMFVGLLRPTAGRIEVFGRPLTGNLAPILRRVGAIVDGPAFYPYLTGRDNLRYFARSGGVSVANVASVLERVDLTTDASRPYATYSLGMKQRLALALALLRDPELLLLDEPTNGLDPAGQHMMRTLIGELAHEGRTIFICSHILHDVEQICHRVGVLRRGTLLAVGSVAELLGHAPSIELRVREAEKAKMILAGLDWITAVDQIGDRLTLRAPLERTEAIVAELAGHQVYPFEIHPRIETLEDLFLEMTDESPLSDRR